MGVISVFEAEYENMYNYQQQIYDRGDA